MKIWIASIVLVVFCQTKYSPNIITSEIMKSVDETVFIRTISHVDTTAIAILPYDSSQMQHMFRSVKKATLSEKDLVQIDNLLKANIDGYNAQKLAAYRKSSKKYPKMNFRKEDFLLNLSRYRRQYIAVINEKGETVVWINCFCSEHKYWRKELVQVFDGGNSYFNIKLNLNQRKLYDMQVNGVG